MDRIRLQERIRLVETGEGGNPLERFPMNGMSVGNVYAYLSYVRKEINYVEVCKKGEELIVKRLMKNYNDGKIEWAKTEEKVIAFYNARTILELAYLLPTHCFDQDGETLSEDESLFYALLIRPFLPTEEAFHKEYDFSE